jgi:Tfp pilus assembly protein PilF
MSSMQVNGIARRRMGRISVLVVIVAALTALATQASAQHDYDYFAALASPGTEINFRIQDVEQNHLMPAMTDIRAGRYMQAWRDLDYLLGWFCNHPRGLFTIATLAQLNKQPLAAMPYFEKAVRLYPQYAMTQAQYGTYLARVGKSDAGVERLKRAIEIDPNFAAAHAWLADVYTQTGKTDLAREEQAKAKELGYKGRIE